MATTSKTVVTEAFGTVASLDTYLRVSHQQQRGVAARLAPSFCS
jgi:hypothetical protein